MFSRWLIILSRFDFISEFDMPERAENLRAVSCRAQERTERQGGERRTRRGSAQFRSAPIGRVGW
jgi:hypothetical protein